MDRRAFLTAKRKLPTKTAPVSSSSTQAVAGIAPYTGQWTTAEVTHLLKRTMFGAAKADIDYFKSKSMSAAVDELLNPMAPMPSPPVKEYVETGATTPDTNIAAGAVWVNDPNTDGTISGRRRSSFKKWWTGVLLNQDRSIREKLTLFWANHFSTIMAQVNNAQFIYKHHSLLRTSCLGNFKTLVKAVTIDPCELVSLSGDGSSYTAPNENYARELQELFTVGKENNPNYTEADVKAAAKVLTGWRTTSSTISSYFDITRHDKTNKQFSSFYNNTIITGRSTATAGDQEIDDLLTMIFNKKAEVSRFIVKKIYRWFCYYNITADVQAAVIDPLAQMLQDNNWEIKPVLAALFKSEHFYDAQLRGCIIKSPVDLAISMFREFNVALPDAAVSYVDAYSTWDYVRNTYIVPMNQDLGDPPNVAGWPAYYQEPQYHELWINANTLSKRSSFTDYFIVTGYPKSGKVIKIDPVAFTKTLPAPDDPNKLIDDTLEILFKVPVSDASKLTVKQQILLTGQISDHYWTDAWIAYLANPDITKTPYMTVLTRLKSLYKYFMDLPEYQLE